MAVQKKEKAGVTNNEVPLVVPVRLKHVSIKLDETTHRRLKAKSAMDGERTGNVLKGLINNYISDAQL